MPIAMQLSPWLPLLEKQDTEMWKTNPANANCNVRHPHLEQKNPASPTALWTPQFLFYKKKIERETQAMRKMERPAMVLSYILS